MNTGYVVVWWMGGGITDATWCPDIEAATKLVEEEIMNGQTPAHSLRVYSCGEIIPYQVESKIVWGFQ